MADLIFYALDRKEVAKNTYRIYFYIDESYKKRVKSNYNF